VDRIGRTASAAAFLLLSWTAQGSFVNEGLVRSWERAADFLKRDWRVNMGIGILRVSYDISTSGN
jgi:hypothetical protein